MEAPSPHEYGWTPDQQISLLNHLKEQVNEILIGREAAILLSEAGNLFEEMLKTPKSSEIEKIRDLLADTEIPAADKIEQLHDSLIELADINPDFNKKFDQFLQKIHFTFLLPCDVITTFLIPIRY